MELCRQRIVNQHSDCNGTAKMLENDKECEMIVVIDNHMTSSAKMADILLPDVTNFEQNDITSGSGGNMGYAIFTEKAIEPMFECKTVYEMCREIAKRLAIEDKFTEGKTQEDWLKFVVEGTRKKIPTFPDYDTFARMASLR